MRVVDADWNHWPDGWDDARIWQLAQNLGVAGIEVGVYDVTVELSAARTAERDRLADRHGVRVASLLLSLPAERWPGGALTAGGDELERLLAQVHGCAVTCAELGHEVLGLWPGADPVGAGGAAEGLAACRDVAAEHGVSLAVEYKPGTVVADARGAAALAAAVPGTGVLLDTGHAWAAGEDPAAVVALLGDLILAMHLGDAALGGSDDDLPLGRLHDVRPLVDALRTSGFTGTAAFDLYGAVSDGVDGGKAVAESLAALRGAGAM